MPRKANDGSEWTNQMMVNRRNASLAARGGQQAPNDTGADQTDDSTGSIEQDPEAMQAVELLVQKGYTADDVAQAMADLSSTSAADGASSSGPGSGSGGASTGLQSIPGLS